MARCGMELCDMWTGDGCYCEFMGVFDDEPEGEPE